MGALSCFVEDDRGTAGRLRLADNLKYIKSAFGARARIAGIGMAGPRSNAWTWGARPH